MVENSKVTSNKQEKTLKSEGVACNFLGRSTAKKKKLTADELEHMRQRDREPVRGIFHFYEVPHGTMKFAYKAYKNDPVEFFELEDGHIHTIPLGVARHLNKNGWYSIDAHRQDEAGNPYIGIGKKVRRFGFQSLEFVDIDDISMTGDFITEPSYIVSE